MVRQDAKLQDDMIGNFKSLIPGLNRQVGKPQKGGRIGERLRDEVTIESLLAVIFWGSSINMEFLGLNGGRLEGWLLKAEYFEVRNG